MDCPKCHQSFDSDRSMKIHHKMGHGSSLAKEEGVCENCNSSFMYYPSSKSGFICPSCVEEGVNTYHIGLIEDSNIPNTTVDYLDVACFVCGKEDSVPPSRVSGDKYICSRSCLDEYNSKRMEGEDNPRYSEKTNTIYGSKWDDVRTMALERDNNSCCLCGSTENIHVHHIQAVKTFDNPKNAHFLENAIVVCAKCHPKVEHSKKEIPEQLMKEKSLVEPDTVY